MILIQPEMEGLAQWSMADVPRLIAEGRRAARDALDAAGRIRAGTAPKHHEKITPGSSLPLPCPL